MRALSRAAAILVLLACVLLAGADGPAEGIDTGGADDGVEAKADEAPPEPSQQVLSEQKAPATPEEPPAGGDGKGIASDRLGGDEAAVEDPDADRSNRALDSDADAIGNDEDDHDGLENDPIAEAFHQHEFLPEYVLTMDIVGARTECVYEEISTDQIPTKFRAAYFTSTGGDLLLDANLYPDKDSPAAEESLYSSSGKTESLVMSDISAPGTYRLCFTNHQTGVTKRTTFAIHIGVDAPEKPEGHAKEEHVHGLNAVVAELDKKVDGVDSEQRYYLARMHRNHYTQESTQSSVMWYTIFESMLMVGVTVAQVYYVRHLINSRSWV